ncbi:3-methyl-2-oxobutanoate hydroxymethyltransferase [Pichia kudriavzevii]|nr:uncharacterized protein C5L36_0D02550 [Pichia kudriavzevii]AWU77511.1 hypothetical protein C5L36_0D02550 [Pichia kudriavzevii]OUT22490.1 3-methyl-2-oxobutanoate hydroxymethyltransferase [Pichia kudriavzevii]
MVKKYMFSALRRYSTHSVVRQSTLSDMYKLYAKNQPISVITAHDFITGRIADAAASVDAVLVGDSLAMVAKGHPSTLELDLDDFYHSTKSVVRGIDSKFIIADIPFGSFESSTEKCVETAIKLMKIGKIGSIKIEGSYELTDRIKTLTSFGIPVTGHLGLTPQRFNALGGFKAQGKSAENALDIYRQALHLQEIGCKMLVLECIPEKLAQFITEHLRIPTIGIGAGNKTSGQVLVMADALGMLDAKNAKFVKQYMNFHQLAVDSLNTFGNEVKSQTFPETVKHTYPMKEEEFTEFLELTKSL